MLLHRFKAPRPAISEATEESMKKSCSLLVLALAGSSLSMAGDTTCRTFLSGVHDNVVVPRNANCIIFDAQIAGNIKVFGALDVFGLPQTTIGGSIEGEPGHRYVRLFGRLGPVTVEGNVQIKGGIDLSVLFGPGLLVRQNLQQEENRGFLSVFESTVGGTFKMEKNTGGGDIFSNIIGGNLQCKENFPLPFKEANAVVGTDQCESF
jgi:hypothetical protein